MISLIHALLAKLDRPEQERLLPECARELPSGVVYNSTRTLLQSLSAHDRDELIGELYGGGGEALLGLLKQITGAAGGAGDAVAMLSHLAGMLFGGEGGGGAKAMLRLCAGLVTSAAQMHSDENPGEDGHTIVSQLFGHLPNEMEHAVHRHAHTRRKSRGIELPHEAVVREAEEARVAGGGKPRPKDEHGNYVTSVSMVALDGKEASAQTEDPAGVFGVLAAGGKVVGGKGIAVPIPAGEPAPDGAVSILPDGTRLDKHGNRIEPIALTHWYEDLMILGNRNRYKNIRPMNFSKALSLIYDTYVRKITKNEVDDRHHHSRESMGSFLRNSFKKLYGIPRVVNENLVGVVHSIELFAGRSRRVRVFGELCGRQQKEHISDRLSDVYLNILTLAWPKFSKAILRSKHEGECLISWDQIRRVIMGVFPKRAYKTTSSKKLHAAAMAFASGEASGASGGGGQGNRDNVDAHGQDGGVYHTGQPGGEGPLQHPPSPFSPKTRSSFKSSNVRSGYGSLLPSEALTKKEDSVHFYIGQTVLSPEVREELYETVARTVFEEKGTTWTDFDVFADVCLEAWKRQTNLNTEVFSVIFEQFCDHKIPRSMSVVLEDEGEEKEGNEDGTGGAGKADAESSGDAENKKQEEEEEKVPPIDEVPIEMPVMTQEAFKRIVQDVVCKGVSDYLVDEMWEFLEPHRMAVDAEHQRHGRRKGVAQLFRPLIIVCAAYVCC